MALHAVAHTWWRRQDQVTLRSGHKHTLSTFGGVLRLKRFECISKDSECISARRSLAGFDALILQSTPLLRH
jgi:hypothetical protein